MGKTQYAQKFRDEWLTNPSFKVWLLKIDNNNSKCRCRFCKTEINSKHFDLVQHAKSKKHQEASKAFSTSRSITSFVQQSSLKTSAAEGALSLFIAAHCSILTCDHLGELCKTQFNESEAGKGIKLHRTKCTTVICNILSPYFQSNLRKSIGDQSYSLLIDESTDISVLKYLGITIMYFDLKVGKIISTYLVIVEMEACVCHTLQLAVSAAASATLPRNIEFLIKETYNWFSHSTLRQAQYKNL